MTSTKVREGKGRRISLATSALGFIGLAAVFGWTGSFIGLHGYAVGRMVGFSQVTAWAVPGAYDGAALACTLAVYRASINGRSAARGRLLMFAFTAISSWINWTHQSDHTARLVAAGLPIAAVIVFDFLMGEMRADWEAAHGRKAFRMRPALLMLRYFVDRTGTRAAFREQITAIPVSALAGLGQDLQAAADAEPAPAKSDQLAEVPEPEPEPADANEDDPTLTDADLLLMSEPPAWSGMTAQAAIERADAILPGTQRTGPELVALLGELGVKTTDSYVRTARRRIRERAELAAAGDNDSDASSDATVYQIPRQHQAGAQSA